MYEIEQKSPHCLQCGKSIYGRKDKKFCDTGCKNAYHNTELERRRKYMKKMEEDIRLNYLLLDEALKSGETSLSLEKLSNFGFRRDITTSFRKRYRFTELGCFDIRYNQSDSKIFNIHRIGLDDNIAESRD